MFTQRRLLTTLRFALDADAVAVEERRFGASRSYRVPYESIPDRPAVVTVASARRLVVAVVLGLLTAVTGALAARGEDVERHAPFVWGALTALAGLWYWASRKSYVVFGEGTWALVLFRDRPSVQATEAFIAELLERRQRYLAERYGRGPERTGDATGAADPGSHDRRGGDPQYPH